MSLLLPRFAFTAPVRCGPVRHEVAPLWNLFDETFSELQRATRQSASRQWNPRFDVKETKEAYSLEGELPGVEQKDIQVEFTDEHTLTIKGRTESVQEKSSQPEWATSTTSEASEGSVKSHQPTVEDEEPANSSAAAEQATSQQVTKSADASQQEVAPATKSDQQYWFRERSVGEFTRSFSFPSRVDQEAVRASLKNGILSVVVPKAAAPESRRINIE